jgi:hypothetical protein
LIVREFNFRSYLLGVAVASLILSGCGSMATRNKFYEPIRAELRANKYDAAAAKLEEARKKGSYGDKDRLIYLIDAGMAYHYAGQYDTSNQRLHLAESTADELYTKSISRAALSIVLNDNALEYSGEDYEALYANLIKALNYMALHKFDDAFVEIRRANDKLGLLEQKYVDAADRLNQAQKEDTSKAPVDFDVKPVRFNNDAFARYLSLHMYAADGKFDDARIDSELLSSAFQSQPNIYSFEQPPIAYSSDSGSILSVVALTGLAPTKQAVSLRLRTDKQLGLVQVLYTDPSGRDSQYGQLPIKVSEDFYFKFQLPTLQARPSNVARIRVIADSVILGELNLIEDVNRVAQETFEARKSIIYFRTIARALAKGLATNKLKKKADTGGLGGWLKKAAIDVGSDVTENADLRSAQLLPGKIYVGDFPVPAGTYDLTVEFLSSDGRILGRRNARQFEVRNGDFNLIQASWLD